MASVSLEDEEATLTPAQKAARTRAANRAAKLAEGESAQG